MYIILYTVSDKKQKAKDAKKYRILQGVKYLQNRPEANQHGQWSM
jgi:hypothetical protein